MTRKKILGDNTKINITRLLKELRSLYKTLRDEMQNKWNRDLPFEELLFDRWERAKQMGFGDGSSIYHNSYVYGNVKVGKNTWIGPFTILDGAGGLEIGSNCSISAGVQIYTHDSIKWAITGGKEPYEYKKAKIEDNCYIGPNVIVQKGVCIGKGSIIGANSVVNKDIPPYSKALGSSAKVVGLTNNREKRK